MTLDRRNHAVLSGRQAIGFAVALALAASVPAPAMAQRAADAPHRCAIRGVPEVPPQRRPAGLDDPNQFVVVGASLVHRTLLLVTFNDHASPRRMAAVVAAIDGCVVGGDKESYYVEIPDDSAGTHALFLADTVSRRRGVESALPHVMVPSACMVEGPPTEECTEAGQRRYLDDWRKAWAKKAATR